MGDPAGIGPEVVLKAAYATRSLCLPMVLGDLSALTETAARLDSPLTPVSWQLQESYPSGSNLLPVLALSHLPADQRLPGRPTAAGGEASYTYVETGIRLAMDRRLQGLVTAPISKAMWHAAGRAYPGHTEVLAALTHTPEVRMMLVGSRLRVILVTTHLALAQVPT
ncbi:MAG: 4-hydroxythreonine-4-phosphate dehydrogenase PdxA, partial [Candidatus Binatia bacterium]